MHPSGVYRSHNPARVVTRTVVTVKESFARHGFEIVSPGGTTRNRFSNGYEFRTNAFKSAVIGYMRGLCTGIDGPNAQRELLPILLPPVAGC